MKAVLKMIFSNRRKYNGRLTIGRSKEGLPLVGFKYRKGYDWLDLNSRQEGVRLVGLKYQKGYDLLDLNSKQEGVWLVGFKYQKGYDWLDSKFNCSYLESRGVPEKNSGEYGEKRGKLSPFYFRFWWRHFRWCNFRLRMPTWSLPLMQFPVTIPHKCGVSCAYILLAYMLYCSEY